VSGLPSLGIPEDILLDKLELFFSKTKNGGSEVESREFLDDCGQVVLTFTQDGGVWDPLSTGLLEEESSPASSGKHWLSPKSRWSCEEWGWETELELSSVGDHARNITRSSTGGCGAQSFLLHLQWPSS